MSVSRDGKTWNLEKTYFLEIFSCGSTIKVLVRVTLDGKDLVRFLDLGSRSVAGDAQRFVVIGEFSEVHD